MKTYPYLRAYMAGIAIPTMLLLMIMTGFVVARHIYNVPTPVERVLVFPMALLPNLWGAWNMLYLFLHSRRAVPLGFYGAALPFVVVPIAFGVTRAIDFQIPALLQNVFPFGFPIVVVLYYLLWKHVVSFFNKLLGIA